MYYIILCELHLFECKGTKKNDLMCFIWAFYFVFRPIYTIFAVEMQISNRQINIALALVAAGLLAVSIASVMSAMN